MFQNILALIAGLSPLLFVITAIVSWFQPGARPLTVKRMATASTVAGIVIAAICSVLVINQGLLQTDLIGINDLGFSLRLDSVSMLMFSMIALLGFIIVRFSINYLDGDQRQGIFIGRLAATIASVQLLVISGNLGLMLVSWILTSISLHRLLVFYKDRPVALAAARKKFILARLGDICLLISVVLLYNQFGSGNLEDIFTAIKNNVATDITFGGIEASAIFLVLAALFKSAQFPTHGWLIEVMETPTPVSALLHAGLLNAGPFLIIRMAYIMDASTIAPNLMIAIGGFTALFGSAAYLTQTSVKTALGYSSIAHMGFSLMVCGLGVYPAAMLHLVAHSFYKAHSFLSSGSAIDLVRKSKIANPARLGSPFKILLGIAMALGLYTGFALLWGIDPERELSLLAIGAVMTMGLSRIFTSAVDSKGSIAIFVQATLLALLVTVTFFSLESGAHYLIASQVPDLSAPSLGKAILTGIILLVFGIAVFMQILSPMLSQSPFYRAMAIHIRNGFYANAIFDRMISALRIHSTESKQLITNQIEESSLVNDIDTKDLKEQLA